MNRSGGRTIGRVAGLVVGRLLAALIVAPAAWASPTPFIDIHSAGPLSDIYIGNDLGCQVREGGFSSTEFFPNAAGPGDCGTFVDLNSDNVDGGLFGPDFANHAGGTHTTFSQGETPFTASAGNQTLTGSGTAASPYQVTTTVTLTSPTGSMPGHLQVTEVDSYVVGRRLLPDGHHGHEHRPGIRRQRRLRSTTPRTASSEGPTPGSARPSRTLARRPPPPARRTRSATQPSALEEFVPITSGSTWEQRTSRRSGRTSTAASSATAATIAGARRWTTQRASLSVPRARPRRVVADVLVRDRDRRHRPDRRPLVHRHRRHAAGRHRRHDHRPEHERHRERVLGDDQLGRRHHLGRNRQRRQRQLHGVRQPPLRSGRHVPGRGHDHLSRHQPGELDRDRLGDDHRDPDLRADGRAVGHRDGRRLLGSANPDGLPTTASFQYGLDPKYTPAAARSSTRTRRQRRPSARTSRAIRCRRRCRASCRTRSTTSGSWPLTPPERRSGRT